MTFEMIMAAMAFLAKADRHSGNYPDYELEEKLIEQQEREYLEYEYEMRKKYPRDWYYDHFVLHFNTYIPAYKEKVDCIIESSGIHVCKHILIEGKEYYLMVLYGGGYEYFEGDDYWISPEKYNDRTKQMKPSTVEALGYAISCGISKMAGNIADMSKYEEQVNRLIKKDNLVFKADRFEFYHQGIPRAIDLYEYASKGVDLNVVLEEDTSSSDYSSDIRISVPFKNISYEGREYIVIPYQYDVCCLCITDNVIMALAIEEEIFILDESQKTLVVKVELRDPFTHKIMNRKDKFEQLRDNDKYFYYEVFKEASKLSEFFSNHSCCDNAREKLLELIENGVLGKQISIDSLNSKMQELSGKQYTCDFQRIVCNGKESTLYQYCKDVYEYKEESKMGLFDSFFAGGSGGKVFNYIQNMSKTALVGAVKSEYEHIKGNCRYTPAMGEFGSFEFAGALLLWKYCRENVRTNLNACGELMITLGETIGCAYNCMSAGEWSDKIDVSINNNDLLNYTEWNQIYNYLKENFANEIHALEFNAGKMSQQQRADVYASFVRTYNSLPDFNSVYEYYTRQGLRLKGDMPFNIKRLNMKTFTEAFNYIKTTSASDIAKRTAIYGAYFNMYMHKNFGHDIILDIVAALCGPFDYDRANDKKILELLDDIEYGFNPNWPNMMIPWINKYASSKREADAFVDMVKFLFTNAKTEEIYKEFNYICQVIRPSEYDYFPEMQDMSMLHYNPNIWKRI